MKIVFWSSIHGQSGATSNMIAIAIMAVLKNNLNVAITQCHFDLNNLERPLVGKTPEKIKDFYIDTGIDALCRQENLTKEVITNCSISLMERKLSLYSGTSKLNMDQYEKDIINKISNVLYAIEKIHDLVIVDAPAGNGSFAKAVIDTADIIVVNLSQNTGVIEDYISNIKKYNFPEKNIFYLVGNYNYNSKYNLKNIVRGYKAITKKNIAVIPYNYEFLDSLSDSEVIKYFQKNINCDINNVNYYFINKVKTATDQLLRKAELC